MDGFVLILAIVVFSVFRNVMAEAKKKQGRKSLPDVLDTITEHDDAQDRALDALQKWEARQQPAAGSQPRPVEVARSQSAEQTRREAYDAIRELLRGKTERPAPQVPARTERTAESVPAERPSAEPTRIRDRVSTYRPQIRGTVQRRTETTQPTPYQTESRATSSEAAPAGLDRLDSLPPIARGILYAELLGKPVAFREPGEGWGD